MKTSLTPIYQKLKKARKDKKYSRRALVERLKPLGMDVTEQTIFNYENGVTVPDANGLIALSKALDVKVGFFCS